MQEVETVADSVVGQEDLELVMQAMLEGCRVLWVRNMEKGESNLKNLVYSEVNRLMKA